MKTMFRHAMWLLVGVAALLAGCAKKPPECADAAAAQSLREFMNESIVDGARLLGANVKKDTGGVIPKYLATWGFELSNVTSQGYDEKSRTRSCAGRVSITIPDTKQTGYADIQYTMQMREDSKSGEFQLKVGRNFQQWAYGASGSVVKHFRDSQTAGTWAGASKCGPTELRSETLGPLPPEEIGQGYTVVSTAGTWAADGAPEVPVEVVVSGGKGEMRMTAGGRTITRATEVGPKGTLVFPSKDELESLVPGQAEIKDGQFTQVNANEPNVAVRAQVKSNATGNVLNVVLVRTCTLNLARR